MNSQAAKLLMTSTYGKEIQQMATRKSETIEVVETDIMTATPVLTEVTRIGNLTKDPVLRYGANGKAIAEVDLAVNPPKDTEGETVFYRLVVFGPMAENLCESCVKSSRVIAVGRPDIDKWIDEETKVERERKKIICTAIGPDLRFATAEVTKFYRTPTPVQSVDVTTF